MLIRAKTLKGYTLDSRDGEIGKVRQFYFDDQHWAIRYLVADTGSWLSGRQVLLSPYALGAVTQEAQHIAIDLTKKQIEDSPSLSSEKPVSQQFEVEYYRYYGYPVYWAGDPICGMAVDETSALRTERNGRMFFFCRDPCRTRFLSMSAAMKHEASTP